MKSVQDLGDLKGKRVLIRCDFNVPLDGDTITDTYVESNRVLDGVSAAGISYRDVVNALEREGLQKFDTSWEGLLATIDEGLKRNS